jgi:hypothetical protein
MKGGPNFFPVSTPLSMDLSCQQSDVIFTVLLAFKPFDKLHANLIAYHAHSVNWQTGLDSKQDKLCPQTELPQMHG